MFQSTPVIANGRIPSVIVFARYPLGFNPRPLLLTGESRPEPGHWRALDGFNPRPLLLTGESGVIAQQRPIGVSFNPRPLLLTGESESATLFRRKYYLFQSTPVIANGRIGAHQNQRILPGMFQSTPVIANGRIRMIAVLQSYFACFNPRPLLLTGESTKRSAIMAITKVSIHARYC